MENEYLLIGGRNDGKRIKMYDIPPPFWNMCYSMEGDGHYLNQGTEKYYLIRLSTYYVYAASGLSNDQVFELLIKNYYENKEV